MLIEMVLPSGSVGDVRNSESTVTYRCQDSPMPIVSSALYKQGSQHVDMRKTHIGTGSGSSGSTTWADAEARLPPCERLVLGVKCSILVNSLLSSWFVA